MLQFLHLRRPCLFIPGELIKSSTLSPNLFSGIIMNSQRIVFLSMSFRYLGDALFGWLIDGEMIYGIA